MHSLPFLKAMRDAFSDAHIEWVISKNLKEILEGNPLINGLIIFNKDSWSKIGNLRKTVGEAKEFIKTLKSGHYDMIVDLQGLLRSGLITYFTSSPKKIGFKNAREGSNLFYNKKISVNGSLHAVDRYLEVARSLGAEMHKVEFPLFIHEDAREGIKNLIGNLQEYVVIVPSARWDTKKWPPEKFGALISKLVMPCIITGGKSDEQTVKQVMAFSNNEGINLCGKTNLKELVALISGAKAVVSNDSGPMHIAAALGVPVIALFGPTDPMRTGPYGWQEKKNLKVVRTSISCSPCFKKKCKEPLCMSGISVEKVLEAVKEYL